MKYKNSHTLSISLRVHIHAKLALYQLYLLLFIRVACKLYWIHRSSIALLGVQQWGWVEINQTQLQQDHEDLFSSADVVDVVL